MALVTNALFVKEEKQVRELSTVGNMYYNTWYLFYIMRVTLKTKLNHIATLNLLKYPCGHTTIE